VDLLAVDGDVVRQRPAQVIKAFLQGLDLAFDYLRQNPDEACRIMAEREGQAEDSASRCWNGVALRTAGSRGLALVSDAQDVQPLAHVGNGDLAQ